MSTDVTVVMATLNAGRYLAHALDSIESQTCPPVEVVIVDGHSTDDTRAIAARYGRVQVIPQEGRGLAAAWNQGVAAASSRWVAFLDSDDLWDPRAIESHLGNLHADPAAHVSVGKVRFFLDSATVPKGFRAHLLNGDHAALMPGCLLVSREAIAAIGPYREELGVATDIEWCARLRDRFAPIAHSQVVLNKRVHENNYSYTSSETPSYARELLKALRTRLEETRETR